LIFRHFGFVSGSAALSRLVEFETGITIKVLENLTSHMQKILHSERSYLILWRCTLAKSHLVSRRVADYEGSTQEMKKNSCTHRETWGQLSRFCNCRGKTIIYKDTEEAVGESQNKLVKKSTQNYDFIAIIILAISLTILILSILSG
jgi:hypothetical protein